MANSNEAPKTEVSGPGALATTGGVAAGEGGVAVGRDVLGNIIKVVNVITIIGGVEGAGQDVLRDLGQQIKESIATGPTGPEDLLRLIQLAIERCLGESLAVNLLDYLQIAGETFGPLIEKYDRGNEMTLFPFGEFLSDMVSLMAASDILAKMCFDAFGVDKEAIHCQDLGAMFTAPSRYRTLCLPAVESTLRGDLSQFLPHQTPLFLYRRLDAWSQRTIRKQELYLGHFYRQGNMWVVCPIQFRGRSLSAYQWQKQIDHVFFSSLTSALLADFVLYIHRLRSERNTAQHVLLMLRKFKSGS